MIKTLLTFESGNHLISYVPPYLTSDVYLLTVDILARDWEDLEVQQMTALASWCAGFCDGESAATLIANHAECLWELSLAMVKAAGFNAKAQSQMSAVLNVWSGGDEYDAKADPPPCNCVKCMGLGDVDTLCKYKGIEARIMRILDWSYLASNPQYLGAPYSLYILAKLKNSSQSNGTAARRQKRDREKQDTKHAKSVQDKYGHNFGR